MPALPPDLYEEIVALCAPLLWRDRRRAAQFLVPLSDWPNFDQIVWEGSPRTFTTRLIYQLPGARLKQTLRALLVGHQDEQGITAICQQIDAALNLTDTKTTEPLLAYHQERVAELSAPPYRLSSRLVQLTLLLDQGRDTQGIRFVQDSQRQKYQSLAALLADLRQQEPIERAVVLLGRSGSGKTTLLRRLQFERAWAELDAPTGQATFFVSLNGYRGDAPWSTPPDPYEWLAAQWQRHADNFNLPDFDTLFRAGRFLLLLDGLNEMPHQDKVDYRDRIGRWQTFWQQHHRTGNTVVFSCLSLEYSAPLSREAAPVRQVQVEPLSEAQIEEFLTLHLDEQAALVWQALQTDRQLFALFATPFFLRLLVDQVADSGEMPAGQAALLTGFVRRALYREIAERKHPLFTSDRLLSEDDVHQVLQRAWATAYDLPGDGALLPGLTQLAYRMQDGYAADEGGQVRVPEKTARALLDQQQACDLLAAGIQLNVLDKELATRKITFFHQLLQEYFAARKLAQVPEPERLAVPWHIDKVSPSLVETIDSLEVSDPLPPLSATGWEETGLLAAAMAADQEQFVANLLPQNLPLAARCAAAPEVTVSDALVERLQRDLWERIGDPKADLRARIVAAEVLGELGDPRFTRYSGPHGDYLLPPFATIAGGTYPIGDDDSQYADEKPAHQVEVAPFEMAVFPVTNAEFGLFMSAGGYADERWWPTEAAKAWLQGESGSEEQKQTIQDIHKILQDFSNQQIDEVLPFTPEQIESYIWLKKLGSDELEAWLNEQYPAEKTLQQPEFWKDGRFNRPTQPVVGITWFEANAYCAWLSAQIGDEIDLPTEVEWEAAAGGLNGRNHAYGNEFNVECCNTFETHIRRTTPVGVFPEGGTPEGIFDLSGNVWEWTRTIWGTDFNEPDYPYPYNASDGREDPADGTSGRVVRGCSWFDDQEYARATYRLDYRPSVRNDDIGFRLVRRPPSHDR